MSLLVDESGKVAVLGDAGGAKGSKILHLIAGILSDQSDKTLPCVLVPLPSTRCGVPRAAPQHGAPPDCSSITSASHVRRSSSLPPNNITIPRSPTSQALSSRVGRRRHSLPLTHPRHNRAVGTERSLGLHPILGDKRAPHQPLSSSPPNSQTDTLQLNSFYDQSPQSLPRRPRRS
jgi:hypothetical protein